MIAPIRSPRSRSMLLRLHHRSAAQKWPIPPKTTPTQAYHFGMYLMKAVLDGRGRELIDLAAVNLAPRAP